MFATALRHRIAARHRFAVTIVGVAVALGPLAACSPTDTPTSPSASPSQVASPAVTSAAQLDGSYAATSSSEGDPPVAIIEGSPVALTFEGGHLSVGTGCNTGHGTVLLTNGRLSVPDLGITRMSCDQELMAQEFWVTDMLAKAQVEVDDAGLTLRWGTDLTSWLTFSRVQD